MNLPSRYKLLTKGVMSGGFGSITPLEDTYLRRVVLLKAMQDNKNNNQLLNEIQGLCEARSLHVVEIYDIVKNEKGAVQGVIIERLRGRDFVNFHLEAESQPAIFLKILYQIATALRDLHAAGIVHRDLKLDNFKESYSGVIKLFDFGISSPDNGYQTKENKGTIEYAAPELYQANAIITPAMDIYAFGVCAWALCCPRIPNELKERPPQQSSRCPSIGSISFFKLEPKLVEIIDACLDPDPKGRPSAAALSRVLGENIVRGQHKGLFVQENHKVVELSAAQPNVALKIGTLGEIVVKYNGLNFKIAAVVGAVRINNQTAAVGDILHKSCLLTFGDISLGSGQQWVTFSSSQPEVIL